HAILNASVRQSHRNRRQVCPFGLPIPPPVSFEHAAAGWRRPLVFLRAIRRDKTIGHNGRAPVVLIEVNRNTYCVPWWGLTPLRGDSISCRAKKGTGKIGRSSPPS